MTNLFNARGAGVVGVREKEGIKHIGGTDSSGEPLTLAGIATVVHYGSEDGRIPSRPFLAATLAQNQAKYINKIRKFTSESILAGDFHVEFEKFLAVVASDVRVKIVDGPWVPNAPSTIARKKSSKPLIDTGVLRASIDYAFIDELPGGE